MSTTLRLRRLQMLVHIARTGSFASAAEALSFTASAVSQQMNALERETGVVLFERQARGVRLTGAGQALVGHAEAVLARLADAEAELATFARDHRAQIRVGSFTSATSTFVAQACDRFRMRHSDSELHFVDGEPHESMARLVGRELDVAVIFDLDNWPAHVDYDGRSVVAEPDVEYHSLFDDPYLLIMNRQDSLAGEPELALEQLAGRRVLVSAPWQRDLEAAFERRGIDVQLDGSCRGTGFEALQAFASSSDALTLMPRLALGWLRSSLVARTLDGAPVRRVKAALLPPTHRSLMSEAMLDLVKEEITEARSDGGFPRDSGRPSSPEPAAV